MIKSANRAGLETPMPPFQIHDQRRRHQVWAEHPKDAGARANMAKQIWDLEIAPKHGEENEQGKSQEIDPAP
jgi:hypothetical protein